MLFLSPQKANITKIFHNFALTKSFAKEEKQRIK